MRIRADVDGTDINREAFSQDILKIEISGPDVSYLFPLHHGFLPLLNVD